MLFRQFWAFLAYFFSWPILTLPPTPLVENSTICFKTFPKEKCVLYLHLKLRQQILVFLTLVLDLKGKVEEFFVENFKYEIRTWVSA